MHPGAVDSVVANNTFEARPDGKFNAFLIYNGGTITQSTTWPVPPAGFCYWLYGDYVELNGASAVWTLQPGTVIKSKSDADIRITSGQFMANGVVFTSATDDTLGAVDGSTIGTGAEFDWEAVGFGPNASDASVISNCVFRYGGGAYSGGLR